jgi:hypothetical protein
MRGAIPPLPQCVFMAWCLVKHRDNFTFTFYYSYSILNGRLDTTAWHILSLRMEEMTSICANASDKQLHTADNWWFSRLEIGRGLKISPVAGCYGNCNEHSASINGGDYLNRRVTY